MKDIYYLITLPLLLTACSTMNDSLQLGAGMGMLAGGAATYAGYSAGGKSPSIETVGIGAGIGAVLGMATAYFTHKKVEEDRQSCQADQIDMRFGDLPPSPFIVPQFNKKKGSN